MRGSAPLIRMAAIVKSLLRQEGFIDTMRKIISDILKEVVEARPV
jgi:hypothetical protein